MIKSIGMVKKPTGRFGNQVLQYLFLVELGKKYNLSVFHGEIDGSDIFSELSRTPGYVGDRLKSLFGSRTIKPEEIKNEGVEWLLKTIETENNKIILEPSILGYTLQTLYEDPNRFLTFSEKCTVEYKPSISFKVAVHFRGTDFAGWNPNAILDVDYYMNAINFCRKQFGEDLTFMLFTDDSEMASLHAVKKYLNSLGLEFYEGTPANDIGRDLFNMSQSDIIISSPSTFSIVAGLVGKKKRIIHSEKWVNRQSLDGDAFWVDVKKNHCDFYDVIALI